MKNNLFYSLFLISSHLISSSFSFLSLSSPSFPCLFFSTPYSLLFPSLLLLPFFSLISYPSLSPLARLDGFYMGGDGGREWNKEGRRGEESGGERGEDGIGGGRGGG